MRRLLFTGLLISLFARAAAADFPPPFLRNPFTTNTADVVSNLVVSIAGSGGTFGTAAYSNAPVFVLSTNGNSTNQSIWTKINTTNHIINGHYYFTLADNTIMADFGPTVTAPNFPNGFNGPVSVVQISAVGPYSSAAYLGGDGSLHSLTNVGVFSGTADPNGLSLPSTVYEYIQRDGSSGVWVKTWYLNPVAGAYQ